MPVVDESWWRSGALDGQPLYELLHVRDFGAVFRFLRTRGWSRAAIAAATGLSETRVRAIAQGKQRVVSVEVLERIADGLAINRGMVGLAHLPLSSPSPTMTSGRLVDSPARLTDTGQALMTAIAGESAKYGRVSAGSNVSGGRLDLLETALDQAAVDLLAGPVMPLVAEVRRIRDEAFLLLRGRQPPRSSRRLYRVSAKACGLLATVAADRFRLYDAATRNVDTASITADLGEEPALDAWAASVRSTIAFWQGRFRTAAMTATAARVVAPPGVETARLASLEARAWARLGDREAMTGALDVARRAREVPGPSAGVGLIAFPLSNQVRIAGTAHLWIGDNANARVELIDALQLLGRDYDSRWHVAATRADLAVAHLRGGELDEAAAVLRSLFASADAGLYLGGAARRAGDLTAALRVQRYASSGLARHLVEEVTAFASLQSRAGANGGSESPADEVGSR